MARPPVRFDFLLFDRHQYPDGIAAIEAGKNGRSITYREEFAKGHMWHRNDIAMLNCYDADGEHVGQKMVYPTSEGITGDAMPYLSEEQKLRCLGEWRKMRELADQYPDYAKAMRMPKRD